MSADINHKSEQASLVALIRSDLQAMIFPRGHGPVISFAVGLLKVFLYPRIRAVIYYRFSHLALCWRLAPVAYALQQWGLKAAGAEIHPASQIGPGFCLFHSSGLVIGDRVIIGKNFRCFHGVTLGDAGATPGQPIVGDNVTIYAGAKVIGAIRVGDRAIIAANAVVLCDVPADCTAAGVPARIFTRRDPLHSSPQM